MTRVTSFLMPKRDQQASTFEEMQAGAQQADDQPKAEPQDMQQKGKGSKQDKRGGNSQKRKRGDGTDKADAAEGGQTNGWGKRQDIMEKAQRTEQRRQGRVQDRNANTTCFACRAKGHAAKDCPNVLLAAANTDLEGEGAGKAGDASQTGESRGLKRKKGKKGADLAGSSGRCYRCDSSEHPLSRCPKPSSVGLPYAHCFICLEKGHLASKCPSNSRGIYPNGGSCKVCGSVQHRAQDCPDDKRGKAPVVLTEAEEELLKMKNDTVVLGTGREAGADEDDFMIVQRRKTDVERKHAEAQAQEKAAKKAQSAQQKRLLQKSQMMGSAAAESEGGPSALSLLQSEDITGTVDEPEPSPVMIKAVARSNTAAPARKKPKVVVF